MKSTTHSLQLLFVFLLMANFSIAQNGAGSGPPWKVKGNNINDAQHFIGTKNAADLVIKTDNSERARVTEIGRVGIGTPSPGAKVMVISENDDPTSSALNILSGSTTPLFHLKNDGKAGLGTDTPLATLQIHHGSDAKLNANTGPGYLIVGNPTGDNVVIDDNEIMARNGSNNLGNPPFSATLFLQNNGGDALFHSGLAESSRMIIKNNGFVGIGTVSPSSSLDIHGDQSFDNTTGDKISLLNDRIGLTNMYGFGVASGALYYKSNGLHQWYSQGNAGAADAKMTLTSAGFLGLGTESPNVTMVIEDANARLSLRDNAGDNSENSARIELLENAGGNFNDGSFIWWNGADDKLLFGTKESGVNTNVMVINHSGLNVGIGTSSPDDNYRLSVNGKVRCKEVVVETGWSDFVFEEDYQLPTLKEVEAHIKKYGHLPGIPSAKEVEENGIGVGEMESLLLQKIEELTLYMIDLKKENNDLKNRITELEN